MLFRLLLVALALFASPALAQQTDPWEVKDTPFGRAAVGSTNVGPNAPAKSWNVLAVGLFCGDRKVGPRSINLYLYGISDERMRKGAVEAIVNVDGTVHPFRLQHINDAVVTTVSPEFVRAFIKAKAVSVLVKDYESPNPDTINMDKAAAAIPLALRPCFKP